MTLKKNRIIVFFLTVFLTQACFAYDPWFTGPFFAESGKTIPKGHSELFLTGYYTSSDAIYNNNWMLESTSPYRTIEINPQFTYGLTDSMDVEWDILYQNNRTLGKTRQAMGDTAILLGFQLLDSEKISTSIRLTLEEIIPTGRFERLSSANHGTDATGLGSYQSLVGLNIEHSSVIQETYTLKSLLSIDYLYATETKIEGISTFGGNPLTRGTIKPGNVFTFDLAEELSLTQHWVAVLEGYFLFENASKFKGDVGKFKSLRTLDPTQRERVIDRLHGLFPSRHNIGKLGLGNDNVGEFTFAPGLEYNFTENCGLIMGSWFTVAGKNTPNFNSIIIGLNTYF